MVLVCASIPLYRTSVQGVRIVVRELLASSVSLRTKFLYFREISNFLIDPIRCYDRDKEIPSEDLFSFVFNDL